MKPLYFEIIGQSGVLAILLGVAGATLASILYGAYRSRKYHLRELKALSLYQDETKEVENSKTGLREKRVSSKIKVGWRKNCLVFSKYNRAFGLSDFKRLQPNLETLFGKKIELVTFEKRWFSSQPRVILHCEVFPRNFLLSQRPKLNMGQIFLGVDSLSRFVKLEVIKHFENTLLILAPKGSGKSFLIISIIKSFFETAQEFSRESEYELIIADNKGTDFIDVATEFNGSYYQPFNLEELREIVQRLRNYKREIEATLSYLKANKLSPRHWDEIRNGKIDHPVPVKVFLVLDEMKAYFGSGKQAPKLSKEPTDFEIEMKERHSLINEFGGLVNYLAEQCRSTGVVVVCASQSPNKSDYDYPDFINFPVLVLGQTNAQQSIQLIGDTSLNDNSLTRGKFVIRDELGVRRFLAPLPFEMKRDENDSK